MMIIGCDLHTRYQQVAMLDTETGELVERRLEHESGEARAFYSAPNFGGNQNEDFPKSNGAARKALELDPALAHPHAVLGSNEMQYDWDFAGGEAEFKKSFELDPNDATARQWYADDIAMIGGREREALAEIKRAQELD